jgi:hypothetical protein
MQLRKHPHPQVRRRRPVVEAVRGAPVAQQELQKLPRALGAEGAAKME